MPDSLRAHGLPHPSSSVHGIFQARVLEWVAISFSRGSSQPRDQTQVSCSGRWILYHCATWKVSSADVAAAAAKSLQSCLTLSNTMDCSPPAPPSMGFSRQEYWSGVPLPSPKAPYVWDSRFRCFFKQIILHFSHWPCLVEGGDLSPPYLS